MRRFSALAVFASFILVAVISPWCVPADTPRNLEFEVIYYETHDHNDTHMDLGLKVKVTNNGKYADFIYKMSFFIINGSGTYFNSKSPGAFKLYSQMFRTFSVNFTVPRETLDEIDSVHYRAPDGDDEHEFFLIPGGEAAANSKEIESWEIIVIVGIGIIFLGILGLIYLITSYTKKKQRRKRFLRY